MPSGGEVISMEERHEGLEGLRKEVAGIRERLAGKRIIWSEAIRGMAAGLVSDGISVGDISKATGITSAAIRLWHRRQSGKTAGSVGFRELGISGMWRGGVVVRFRNGTEISGLQVAHIERFLKSGLL